ncbi:adenosine deaminase [Arenivirga flava]|uniref:adenosine deaminase n=1 Tax=Arenivirga flava TaxID=1930060 RepID=A0AA37UTJ5_9MICO|nr:adenosine deaminase [Arenivirga flava]GMA28087.1 adenosine deaminase 2 [Arenivirga flava]
MSRLPEDLIRSLPKVSLHDHLDGGLRPQTIIDLAEEQLPASSADELAAWFERSASTGSLEEYLRTFEITVGVMQTRENLIRVAREFVEDLVADGVVHGEIRWAPEQHLRGGLSLDEAVEAVQEGIDQAVEAAEAPIGAGQILCALRHLDRSGEIAELALRHRDRGVLGFDIAGPEIGHAASGHREAFELLAAQRLPVTVHAGEADGVTSIDDALLAGRALRLGHGVAVALDIELEQSDEGTLATLGRTAQWVRDREITLEVAPSSNLQTEPAKWFGPELADQPFDLLYQLGYRVTVNPDNRLMSATSITRELTLLAEAFDYDLADLEVLQLNAAAASFLPLEQREELAELISDGFEAALLLADGVSAADEGLSA